MRGRLYIGFIKVFIVFKQIAALENALTETHKGVEDSQAMKVVWETQLKSIREEVARLMCETGQLKDCNAALHEQVGKQIQY